MTFLAPAWLWIAAAAAAAVVALHFFARQRPRPALLPTARFVPDIAARAPSIARRPSDALVMLLRLLALAAAGLALAGPQPAPSRRPVARVVVVAASGTMRSVEEALDSARALIGDGDTLEPSNSPTISSALIAAVRASSALRDRADSLELVLVSSFAEADFDAATDSIRRLWPGRARLMRVAAVPPAPPRRVDLVTVPDDPLRATVALLGARRGAVTRIVRGRPSGADSAFARHGGVLVDWPLDPAARWPAGPGDTAGAVAAGDVVVVAPFVRTTFPLSHSPTLPPSGAAGEWESGRAIAFWVDGLPAAREQSLGAGCLRQVAVPVPATGDLALRRSMRDLVEVLAAPCGGAAGSAPAPDELLERLRGQGALMPARFAPEPVRRASVASAWLLGLAALLLALELAARARRGPA